MPSNPHSSAQQVGEQPGVRPGRNAVDVGVRVHHRAGAGAGHRRLERRQDHVHQLAPAHRHGTVVAGRARGRVPGEVFQGGDDPGALQAPDVGGAEHRDEVGVLAHGLLDPAPAVVADDVQHGGQALVYPDRRHVPPDRGGHPLDEIGVERGAPGDRRRVHRRAVRREPGEALLVDERRNPQARSVEDDPVLADQLRHALRDGHWDAAVHPGEVAEPVPARLLQRPAAGRGEDVLHRGDVVRGVRPGPGSGVGSGIVLGAGGPHVVADPPAAELGDLLLQGHVRQQQLDPLGNGECGVLPRPCRRRHEGPPFPLRKVVARSRNFRKTSGRTKRPGRILHQLRPTRDRLAFIQWQPSFPPLDRPDAESYVNLKISR